MAKQVQFYRGASSQYITDGTKLTGADVAYNSAYEDAVFYATDQKVIYVNGIKYGYDMSSGGELQQAFLAVAYTEPTSSTNGKITFTSLNGETHDVSLFHIASKTNAINVTYNGTNKQYEIGLDISETDEVLTQENDGLKVNIDLSYDPTTKKILLTGKTSNSSPITISEVDATDFVRDGMIRSVSTVTVTAENVTEVQAEYAAAEVGKHYLRIEWNSDAGQGSNAGTDNTWYDSSTSVINPLISYVSLESFFNIYTSGNKGIDITGYTVTLTVKSSEYLSISNDGLTFDDASIDWQFSQIKNRTINTYAIGDGDIVLDASDLLINTDDASLGEGKVTFTATDTINKAIAKLNIALLDSANDLTDEVNAIEESIGLAADGSLGNALSGTNYLNKINPADDEEAAATTLIEGVKKLDTKVHDIDLDIQSMDFDSVTDASATAGDNIVYVSQSNGHVTATRDWTVDHQLHGYVAPTNGTLSASTTIVNAFATLDGALSWHEV